MNKKSQKLSIISVFVLSISLLASSGLQAAEQKNSASQQTAKNNKYPQDAVSDYMKNCTAVASKQLPQEAKTLAKDLCTCTLNKFQSQYNYSQYQKLSQEAKEEVGYSCFEKYLYEE